MCALRRPMLAVLALTGGLAALLLGNPGARAQLPPPSVVISVLPYVTTDGHGIVLTWSVGPLALNADGFIIFRRNSGIPNDSGAAVAGTGAGARGYTDYTLTGPGAYCYRVGATLRGTFSYASGESCAVYFPGSSGAGRPVFPAGCSRFFQTQPVGVYMPVVAAHFDPTGKVSSIWRVDPLTRQFVALFFADPIAPPDAVFLTASAEFQYVCLSVSATYH